MLKFDINRGWEEEQELFVKFGNKRCLRADCPYRDTYRCDVERKCKWKYWQCTSSTCSFKDDLKYYGNNGGIIPIECKSCSRMYGEREGNSKGNIPYDLSDDDFYDTKSIIVFLFDGDDDDAIIIRKLKAIGYLG